MTGHKRFQWRSKENFLNYMRIELALFKREWMIIVPCVIMQYVHGIFHNIAYWVQAHKLSDIQRFTLHDLGFDLMDELTGSDAHWSDYLVFGGIFAPAILLVLTIPAFTQNPNKPRYLVIVLKRVLLHISIALVFRIISFLITTLPSPAAHCRLEFNETCRAEHESDPIQCVVPNPDFKPPHGSEFFTNLDSLNGCGDLMFSSHTIYTMSFILTAYKFWWNKFLFTFMVCIQIAIVFLIIASRKHYSLDVFTALYVVPLLWFTQDAYYKDINCKDTKVSAKTIQEFYGVDVSSDLGEPVTTPLDTVQVSMAEDSSEDTNGVFQRKSSM